MVPAVLVWFIRRYVPEPPEITSAITARRNRKRQGQASEQDRFVLRRLLTPPFLRSTLICTALATGSLIAFWSVSTWYPQIIRLAAAADSLSVDDGNHRVAIASMLFNAGGILGYATWGFIADAIGRRKAFALSFAVSAVSVVYLFPFERSYTEFLIAMPFIGFGLFGALSGTFVYGPGALPAQRAGHRYGAGQQRRPVHHRGRPADRRRHRRVLVRRRPRHGHHLRCRLRADRR